MDAAYARITTDGLLRGPDDRFAIFAEPPGIRNLALPELWERSAARSRRRRQAAAARLVALPRTATARISAALIAAGLIGQTGPLVGAAGAAQASTVDHDLRSGARGSSVDAVQRALGLSADGVFGPQTRRAVRAFQRAHGLAVDGIVGPQTRAALGLGAAAGARSGSGATTRAARLDARRPAATTQAGQRALGLPADRDLRPQP